MPKRNDPLAVTGTETIIGSGVKLKGILASDSDISIDGWLDGEIKAGGNVMIGPNGVIRADITAVNVVVSGQLKGNIDASGETHISDTGNVRGNIITTTLGIDPGALFIGRSTMTKSATPEHLADDQQPDDDEAQSSNE